MICATEALAPRLYLQHWPVGFSPLLLSCLRLQTNDQYFNRSDPNPKVFLYVEGEGTGSPYDVVGGQHVELAQVHGALLLSLEHRYYGASIPTADLSTPNMRYLSSHQAVGDVALFITQYVLPTYNLSLPSAQIVTFGGSYPGALSAWLRLRLPHLITVGVSTSSPIQAQFDYTGYNQVCYNSLSNPSVGGSPQCVAAVSAAFAAMDAAFTGTPAQRTAMASKLSSCQDLHATNDTMWAASNIASVLMGIVQYNDEGGGLDVAAVCKTMLAPGVQPIDGLATVVQASLGGAPCMDNSYADYVAQLSNATADKSAEGVGIRQWTWQCCTQFSYWQTCEDGTPCPFSKLMTLDSNTQQCADGFTSNFTFAVNQAATVQTNALLGGNMIGGSRIIFQNGDIDPWHVLSIYQANNAQGFPSVFIPGAAHCRPMSPSSPNDPPAVIQGRKETAAYLANYLS